MFFVRNIRLLVVAVALALAPLGSTSAETQPPAKRWAFVVGNDLYKNLPEHQQLKKAVSDSRAIASVFRELGYDGVLTGENLGRSDFNDLWQKLLDTTGPEDTVSIYFSGHGIEIDGRNYLIPSDFPKALYGREERAKRESISVSELLQDLKGKKPRAKLVLMILDACRDHPLIPPGQKDIGDGGGLATMDPPSGTFIMYAAGAGETALDHLPGDDPDPNSVYTRKLIPLLKTKGLTISELAQRVRRDVYEITKPIAHNQVPAYYDGVLNLFCVAGCKEPEVAVAATPAPATPGASPTSAGNGTAAPSSGATPGTAVATDGKGTPESQPGGAAPSLSDNANTPSPQPPASQKVVVAEPFDAPPDPKVLTRSIQQHLKRLGCFTIEPTGTWGPKTTAAAKLFNANVDADKAIAETGPSKEADIGLAALEDQVCQPQEAVAILNADETCESFSEPMSSPTPPATFPKPGTFVFDRSEFNGKNVDGLFSTSYYRVKKSTSLKELSGHLATSGNTEFFEYTPTAPFACGHALFKIKLSFHIFDIRSALGQVDEATGAVNARVSVLRWQPAQDDSYEYSWEDLTTLEDAVEYDCEIYYDKEYECSLKPGSELKATKSLADKLSDLMATAPEIQ